MHTKVQELFNYGINIGWISDKIRRLKCIDTYPFLYALYTQSHLIIKTEQWATYFCYFKGAEIKSEKAKSCNQIHTSGKCPSW